MGKAEAKTKSFSLHRFFAALSLAIFFFGIAPSRAVGRYEIPDDLFQQALEAVTQKYASPLIFYHWTSRFSGVSGIENGRIPDGFYNKAMAVPRMFGPGVYVDSEKPVNWSSYGGSFPDVVEFVAQPGCKYIDLFSPETKATLERLGIPMGAFSRKVQADARDVILQIGDGVAAIRTQENVVVRPFSGEGLSTDRLLDLVKKISKDGYGELTFRNKVASIIRKRISDDPQQYDVPGVKEFLAESTPLQSCMKLFSNLRTSLRK